MRSWSVPNAAIEPTRPLSRATHTMLGSVRTRCQKSGAPGVGPQLTTESRPAAPATWRTAATPPSMWRIRNTSVANPAPRNTSAWKTFVHTTAVTPPVAI